MSALGQSGARPEAERLQERPVGASRDPPVRPSPQHGHHLPLLPLFPPPPPPHPSPHLQPTAHPPGSLQTGHAEGAAFTPTLESATSLKKDQFNFSIFFSFFFLLIFFIRLCRNSFHLPSLQRGRYDYWRGFGSDGAAGLYDFVKRANWAPEGARRREARCHK